MKLLVLLQLYMILMWCLLLLQLLLPNLVDCSDKKLLSNLVDCSDKKLLSNLVDCSDKNVDVDGYHEFDDNEIMDMSILAGMLVRNVKKLVVFEFSMRIDLDFQLNAKYQSGWPLLSL